MHRKEKFLDATFIAVAVVVLVVGWIADYSFVGGHVDLVGGRPIDGFSRQMEYVENAFMNGGLHRLLLTDGLLFLHTVRYLVVWPFVTLEGLGGGTLPLGLLIALLYPLSRYQLPSTLNLFDLVTVVIGRIAPVLVLLLVSGRTSIVALGAGYLVSAIYTKNRIWVLSMTLGVTCISLSSSVALLCFVTAVGALLLYPWIRKGRATNLAIAVITLSILLVPSVLAKYQGFTSARDGYLTPHEALADDESFDRVYGELSADTGSDHTVRASSVFERAIYRSTLYISYIYDQRARLVIYLAAALLAASYVGYCLVTRQVLDMTVPVAVMMFGSLLEGLGFWTLLWPLVWALTGPGRPLPYLFCHRAPEPDKGAFVQMP